MYPSQKRLSASIANAHEVEKETLTALLCNGLDIEEPGLKKQHMIFIDQIRQHQKKLGQHDRVPALPTHHTGRFPRLCQVSDTAFSDSPLVKYCIIGYTMTHLAIAAYIVLITVADEANQPELSILAREILHQKMMMGQYFEDYMAQNANHADSRNAPNTSRIAETREWAHLLSPGESTPEFPAPLH